MKTMLAVITRDVRRPLHNELKANLIKQPEWANADADLCLFFHGTPPDERIPADDLALWTCPWLSRVVDYRRKTNGNITQLVYQILNHAATSDYKYLMLLDDDARFVVSPGISGPGYAVDTFIKALSETEKAGQVGPMGPLRKKWRYDNQPDFMQRLRHNPWTTLGCQVYNLDAIRNIAAFGMLDNLPNMEFRADSFIAMALDIAGYGVYETDVPFAHALHSGQRSKTKTAEHHRAMLQRGEVDWYFYKRLFERFARPEDQGFYSNELMKLVRAHNNHHTAKIAKLGG